MIRCLKIVCSSLLFATLPAYISQAQNLSGDSAESAFPRTAAGRALQSWLDAFNSGDPNKLDAFIKTTNPAEVVSSELSLRHYTGGFTLLRITSSQADSVTFVLKEKNSQTQVLGSIRVADKPPHTILSFGRSPIPEGAIVKNHSLEAAEKEHVIQAIILNLQKYYVDPTLAQKMADALLSHEKNGDDTPEMDGAGFADLLTRQLRNVSRDRHLSVNYHPFQRPAASTSQRADEEGRFRAAMMSRNCEVSKVEILSHNVGYLKIDAFPDPSVCRPLITKTMERLDKSSAIIFDLRENGGGSPEMVALVCSYLFDRRTHLTDMYDRAGNETWQSWTQSPIPGNHLADKPAYVLTSASTFSGAEEFTYDLKSLKRAIIVGEQTGGGAHFGSAHAINEYFTVSIPSGRPINPITKTDWEGTGVEPDVKVPASEALEKAEKLVLEKLPASVRK